MLFKKRKNGGKVSNEEDARSEWTHLRLKKSITACPALRNADEAYPSIWESLGFVLVSLWSRTPSLKVHHLSANAWTREVRSGALVTMRPPGTRRPNETWRLGPDLRPEELVVRKAEVYPREILVNRFVDEPLHLPEVVCQRGGLASSQEGIVRTADMMMTV